MTNLERAHAYRGRARASAVVCLGLLLVLSGAVASGVCDRLDVSVRDHFRPNFIWGTDQQRAAHVVSALEPTHMTVLLAIGSAGVALWRLNVWPLIQSALALSATGALTLALKLGLDRADPKGEHTGLGGSFPSGHSAVLVVGVATGAMLVSCPTQWWQRAGVGLLWGVLTIAMLYDGIHWLTDIVGGALVAGVVLGALAALLGPTGGPSHVPRRRTWRTPSRASPRRAMGAKGKIS